MGRLGAMAMKNAIDAGELDFDTALLWHLGGNHYPPVHPVFLDTAKRAIELANEGVWDEAITMPNGITLDVATIVEELHLESFLEVDGD